MSYESIEAMFGFAFGLEDKINQLDKEYKDVISGFYIGPRSLIDIIEFLNTR